MRHSSARRDADQRIADIMMTRTRTVQVLPRWRIYHDGRVYEAGELVDLPILQACEWSAWGSVEPVYDRSWAQ